MRIALLGTRGIPANYGGFETFAEELSRRLVTRGHRVTVYSRERHPDKQYLGVDLQYLPTIRHKYFDTLTHTFLATLHLLVHRHDVALYCNAANAIFTWVPRVTGIPVALNVDGLERKRRKWNLLARSWYYASEWLSTWMPNTIISDAEKIRFYYRQNYGAESTFIPYGAETGKIQSTETLQRLGLQPGEYFLYVSRLEPENNALLVRQAFEQTSTNKKLAVIGHAPYAEDYIAQVRDTKDPRVIVPGAIYGEGYKELQSHCFAYIHATEVGGTHPALIEAMGRGALTLYLDTPENREVAGEVAIPFTPEDLTRKLDFVLSCDEQDRAALRVAAEQRVQQRYSWDYVTDAYEHLLGTLLS